MPEPEKTCGLDHNMLEYSISRLTDKIDGMVNALADVRINLQVMDTKVDDFSYRLKKLEDRDNQVKGLLQRVDLIVQKLEPDVNRIAERQRQFEKETSESGIKIETRLTKIENNWAWVVATAGIISGIIVAIIQHMVLTVFFK